MLFAAVYSALRLILDLVQLDGRDEACAVNLRTSLQLGSFDRASRKPICVLGHFPTVRR